MEDIDRILESAKFEALEDGDVGYSRESMKKTLDEIKRKSESTFVIENDLLGVRVFAKSQSMDTEELAGLVFKTLTDVIEKTPTRIPLGVA